MMTSNDESRPVGRPLGLANSGRRALIIGLSTCALPGLGRAQSLAARPIKLVVGFAPGGSADFVPRIVAPRLAQALGSPVVVENRAGAGGMLAGAHVAKSKPDGTTLLVGSASPVVISPQVVAKPLFDPLSELVGINTIGLTPQIIAVNPVSGVRTFKDLITLARTRQVSLASSGTGGMTHLTIELLIRASRSNIVHVPYKGAGPGITDALAGHVQGVVSDASPLLPFIRDARLTALAVTSEKRVSFLPEVPAASEELPGFGATNWAGVLAPAATPRPVLQRLDAALRAALTQDDVKAQLRQAGFLPSTMESPDAFQNFVAQDHARWGKLIRELNIVIHE